MVLRKPKLFYSDGTPVSGAYVNGSKWSDRSKHPLYMWNGATTITAHWKANYYKLTLNYNNATTLPSGESAVAEHNNFLHYDSSISNIYGPGRVKRSGYTFNGWWVCNSSGKVAKLWDNNGDLIKNVWINGQQWSDNYGNYKWDGDTYVIADWVKMKPNKHLRFITAE
jgi:hypothetical protein